MWRKTSTYEQEQYSGESNNDRMNSWKGEQLSPADTYIEWCFEQKCKQLSNGFDIITEWRTRKQQYVQITGTTIFDFQHYSRHDASHSISILVTIELLLGKRRVDLLSAGDLWLLLEAAYSHDAGMALNYDEVLKLWTEDAEFQEFIRECIDDDFGDVSKAALYYKEADNLLRNRSKMENLEDHEEIFFDRDWPVLSQKYILILVTEYIRKKHAERVVRLFDEVDSSIETVIPSRLYRVAVMVCQMHGKTFGDIFETLKYYTKGFGSGTIHPQFAAAMLRIGDLLDIDNNRFSLYSIEHFGRLPLASLLHLKKHKAITHIGISEAEIIAEAHTDEYDVGLLTKGWFHMIDEEVRNLICSWNTIVPEALIGCTLQQSRCIVYMRGKDDESYQVFNSGMQREFTINKKKLINLLIGTSIYDGDMDFLREYLQNAMDASKMQLWLDLERGKYNYESLRNNQVVDLNNLTPFDLDNSVYNQYRIQISIEWNSQNNRIQLKISDDGIGIEEDYLKNLSNIGTGWRGRTAYKKELKKMVKWLKPTGGFGIGIQSAFMVTDKVEIVTKSEKDVNCHKIILKSPDKVGSVSSEEMPGFHKRGTTVMLELEPEKFQDWARRINRDNSSRKRYFGDEHRLQFERDKWDEFDLDAVLDYAQKIIYRYVQNTIPNPLFPIGIMCPVMKSMVHRNTYMEKIDYWKDVPQRQCISEEVNNGQADYQCIFIPEDSEGAPTAIVWEKNNCIFEKFQLKLTGRNVVPRICFMNVLVRGDNVVKLASYQRFGTITDFMGFQAENCLKVHRNSFSEKFHLENYCDEGFRTLLLFLKDLYQRNVSDSINAFLRLYEVQMVCLTKFHELYIETDKLNMVGNRAIINLDFSIDDKDGAQRLVSRAAEERRDNIDLLRYLECFYRTLGTNSGGILVALEMDEWQTPFENKIRRSAIHRNRIIEWISTGHMQNANEELFLNLAKKDIGAIKDPFTINALMSDERFDKEMFRVPEVNDYCFLLLSEKVPLVEMPMKDIYHWFWSEQGDKGRKTALYTASGKYHVLRVDARPYEEQDLDKRASFLISPISNTAYQKVMQYKELGKRLDYAVFREMVWGKKGEESPAYGMLIEWVVKHQLEGSHTGREEIKEAYEELLKDIYRECVHDT